MNFGAGLWIGHLSFVLTSPFSSIESPTTLIILPSVSGPTGTLIGEPVFITSSPLLRPSVAVSYTHLTLPTNGEV